MANEMINIQLGPIDVGMAHTASMDRRKSVKTTDRRSNYQEKRRTSALEKQLNARQQALDARRVTLQAAEEVIQVEYNAIDTSNASEDATGTCSVSGSQPEQNTAQFWASLLMLPEWLIEVPLDLGTAWYVAARPEGQRCIVHAAQGRTVCRLKNGRVNETFSSGLPGGGSGDKSGYCILDCIYHAINKTYYVLDVISWRGIELTDCTTEFRLYWIRSKLTESATNTNGWITASGDRRFLPLEYSLASQDGLQSTYSNTYPFKKDGLYFIHREAHYWPGQTPLALLWKDATTSRYFLDTDKQGVPLVEQHTVLRYSAADGTVRTSDDVALGTLPQEFTRSMASVLPDGRLLKFILGSGGISFHDGSPVGADLKYEGPSNRRGAADSLSRTVFQYLARTRPIDFQSLLDTTEAAMDDA